MSSIFIAFNYSIDINAFENIHNGNEYGGTLGC